MIMSWFWSSLETIATPVEYANADTTTVTVTASVTSVLSCSTNTSTATFGAVTTGAIKTAFADATTTMSCANSALGCVLNVKDAGGGGNPGLWNSAITAIIPSPDAGYGTTALLAAGTEGYGILAATSTDGSGAALTIAARYYSTSTSSNTVGGLLITNTPLASTTVVMTGRKVGVTHKAAISSTTASGIYNDTITYECTEN
jgi:hypothetical protein